MHRKSGRLSHGRQVASSTTRRHEKVVQIADRNSPDVSIVDPDKQRRRS